MVSLKHSPAIRSWPWILSLVALIPLTASLAGCNNSCFAFVSNPGGQGGTAAVSSPCVAPVQHGSVQVAARLSQQCESCATSNQVQTVFVTLRGIELHLRTDSGADSFDWQELYPALALQPRQFDLTAAGRAGAAPSPLGDASLVAAGIYDLVRLRLASDQAEAGTQLAAGNLCGKAGLHCAVMGDGRILPFISNADVLELRISSQASTVGSLVILPDSKNQLLIELTPVWSLVTRAGESVRLSPVLTGTAQSSRSDLW